ncbi:MAG: class I SAM-dependent methyltransferase [Treponema sp.]|jgi:23S rRNA G2069 N7-methylase RlmK/C1962 C5-methylase RlmI|nr:class I SAM-dependent methyltransferase [Treponema sp.]
MNYADEKTENQAVMLANRLKKRWRHLKKWAHRTGAGVFRLYDRDIPEIPLVLDYFGNCALPEESALSGALYKRPYEKSGAEEGQWLLAMKNAASQALNIPCVNVFLKQRSRQKGASQYEKIDNARFIKVVKESGLSFKVNLSDYLDCGLFPDKRLLRGLVRKEATGKSVLNLFSYTGSFSIYAAAGGAASTDSVDLSNTYLAWARENFLLNGFSAYIMNHGEWEFSQRRMGIPRGPHALIRADALVFLDKAAASGKEWDLIILDPPVFSNSKKMAGNFDLRRDIVETTRLCLGLLAQGGKLILSVNAKRHKITARKLEEALSGAMVADLGDKVTDEDFRGRRTPSSFLLTL